MILNLNFQVTTVENQEVRGGGVCQRNIFKKNNLNTKKQLSQYRTHTHAYIQMNTQTNRQTDRKNTEENDIIYSRHKRETD
jgi:hypothetical protein